MLATQIFQRENRVYRYFHFREITSISKRILPDFTREILYRKFQGATSLDTQGLQEKIKFEEKEIAEGVREMNFRKIFFMETIGEAEREKQRRGIGGLQNRCSVGISLTVYPCKKGVKKDPTFNGKRKSGVALTNI